MRHLRGRCWRLALGFIVVSGVVFGVGAPVVRVDATPKVRVASAVRPASPAIPRLPFLPSPCDLAPIEILKDGCKAATDVTAIPGFVAGAADSATGGVVTNIFDSALG